MCWAAEVPLKQQWALSPAERTDSFTTCAHFLTYPALGFLSYMALLSNFKKFVVKDFS